MHGELWHARDPQMTAFIKDMAENLEAHGGPPSYCGLAGGGGGIRLGTGAGLWAPCETAESC